MLISLVTLLTTLVFLKGVESTLLEPVKQCVPTATVRGPCHVCVCSHEGVFHCRAQKCEDKNEERSRPKLHCIPNNLFRQNNTFCGCSAEGFWLSDNCEASYRYIYPRITLRDKTLRTNIQCTANNLYLIDCNICRCSEKGIIDVTLCSSRSCGPGHKAQDCSYGDILRLDNQLCSCSDINYYIDRLCIEILDKVVQPLKAEDILLLDDIGRSWRRLSTLADDCSPTVNYEVDCNQCVCVTSSSLSSGRLVCTKKVCRKQKSKNVMRQKNVNEVDSLPELDSVDSTCEPGQEYRFKCNVCFCAKDGSPSCTTMVCLENYVLDLKALRTNVTRDGEKLPEIKYGEKCTYGKRYRMDCNICHCGHQNNLLCTKAACLRPMEPPPEAIAYKGPHDVEKPDSEPARSKFGEDKTVKKKKKARKAWRQRRDDNEPPKSVKIVYPELPSGFCRPGRIYQEGCQRCYCKANKKPICSTENACNVAITRPDLRAVDVRTPIKEEEFNSLEVLPHAASPCEPGTTYKVDCNACVCDEFKNLLCDKLLCISYADMHRAEAMRRSGLKCNKENFLENEIIQSKCVECTCNGITRCKAKEGCEAEEELAMRTSSGRNGSGLAYDYTVEKCLPEHIYKDNCNKCYCQEDQTLRCTQKTCLNYKQAVMLDKQQKYLQEHGL